MYTRAYETSALLLSYRPCTKGASEGEAQECKRRHASLTCCHALLRMSQAAQRQMAWNWHCNESPRGLPPACLPAHYCQAGRAVMTCCQGFCLSLWGPQCSDSARRAVWLELSWYKCPQEYLQPACLSGQPHMLEPACAAALKIADIFRAGKRS